MSAVLFSLDTLSKVDDGRVEIMFRRAIEAVVADCEDRPAEKTGRKVTLEVELKPVLDVESGHCDGLKTTFKCKQTIPQRKTRAVDMAIRAGGKAVFSVEEEESEAA